MILNNSTFFLVKLFDLLYCNIFMILRDDWKSFCKQSKSQSYILSLLFWVSEVNGMELKCYFVYYREFVICFAGCCLHQPHLQTGVTSSQHHLRHVVVQAGAGEGGTQPSECLNKTANSNRAVSLIIMQYIIKKVSHLDFIWSIIL